MWEILRKTRQLAVLSIVATTAFGVQAQAETLNQNVTSGFTLPGVSLPSGSDEVRAADGTTCRSAVSGSGAYLDMGFIGNPDSQHASAYGRMVIPLGKKTKRLDCSKLYDLEVARLEMELKLMQMGLTRGIGPVSEGDSSFDDTSSLTDEQEDAIQVASISEKKDEEEEITDNWVEDGWSKKGLSD